ncbi:hypothetical protein [Catellatospora sp. NPDC049133]|uniref:hypothetical protein n=1 Tax=Catellatospora sp. NPDC049133 TaxID=3155499 RepID=UPI003403EC3B
MDESLPDLDPPVVVPPDTGKKSDGSEPASQHEAGTAADSGDAGTGTTAAEKEADGDAPRQREKQADRRTAERIADVVNIFQDQVRAGTVGLGRGGGKVHRVPTGNLYDAEIRTECEHYCRPEGFDEVVERLASDRVVTICGPSGLGKRAAGINLLREVTHGQLVVMSAVSDLKELGSRSYKKDYGYLIVNHTSSSEPADADFAWRMIRDRVRLGGAYLVVTSVMEADNKVEAVRQFSWRRAELDALVKVRLSGTDLSGEVMTRITEQFRDEYSMTDVCAVLARIADGEAHDAALEALVETSSRRVREWFELRREVKDLPDILDVTAMAFLGESTHRAFEAFRSALDDAMQHYGVTSPPKERRKKAADKLPKGRAGRLGPEGLLIERRVTGRTSDRRILAFRNESYRKHVLAELCRRFEMPFWNATAAWLATIVERRPNTQVATGLAMLAQSDFEEVDLLYLVPWSKGTIGPNGQATAVYVLWCMCFEENTLPTALKVAKQWANHGDPEQRWSAAMAYSGELGSWDPAQAIRQLWQLIIHSSRGFDQACFAMAALFDTLLEGTDVAGKVLSTLETQLHRVPARREDRVVVHRARRVLAEILSMRENQHRVPVTFLYLKRYPGRVEAVAQLWAEGIRYRPYRKTTLEALWEGLNRLEHISEDPIEFASELGEALVAAMPADEVEPFYQDFLWINSQKKDRAKSGNSPALVLLDVIGRHYRQNTN